MQIEYVMLIGYDDEIFYIYVTDNLDALCWWRSITFSGGGGGIKAHILLSTFMISS